MTQLSSSQEAILRNIYEYAADLQRHGVSGKHIQEKLVSRGLDQETAATIAENLRKIRSKAIRNAAAKNMAIGAAVCLIGVAVTWVSYTAASESPTGGRYVVAWGAVAIGALQFLRGLYQWITNVV